MEELIFKGAYTQREIRVSKLIGLAYSWKEIYVSNLPKVFTYGTCCEDMDLLKTQPCKLKAQPQILLLKCNTRFKCKVTSLIKYGILFTQKNESYQKETQAKNEE